MMDVKSKIAIATGDPAGIGPEISLKAALDPAVRKACNPILVSDPDVLERHAKACRIRAELRVVERIADADCSDRRVNVLACAQPELEPFPLESIRQLPLIPAKAGIQVSPIQARAARLHLGPRFRGNERRTRTDSRALEPDRAPLAFGATSAVSGRASLAFAGMAIKAALAGEVDAVVAAPQNETSIALAGIEFDGYPSFVARATGTDENDVYLMLCFGETKIVHATLHRSVKDAIALITREKVSGVIYAADRALRRLGIDAPKIGVGGLNPHAGEGGLFGREESEIIKPAIDAAAAQGIQAIGPFGADTMFQMPGVDAFIVMLHDQGHIAAKLLAPNATAALTIGTPILFSSVAHGSAHDIAGKGVASPQAMIEAVLRLSKAKRPVGSQ